MFLIIIKLLVFVSLAIILTQDFQIFPLYFSSLVYKKGLRDPETIPDGVESFFLTTPDNKRIEVWHVPAKAEKKRNETVIIFHGNGELVDTNVDQQRWFAEQGYDSYSFDYRGYGRSSGRTNEKGIYIDGDSLWNHLKLDPQKTILVGYSLGSAPAARLASIVKPKTLLLIAGYINIRRVVLDRIIFAPLIFFLWTKLSTKKYVSQLENTNLILTHGKNDLVILFHHMEKIAKCYRGNGKVVKIENDKAAHLDIFWLTKDQILENLF